MKLAVNDVWKTYRRGDTAVQVLRGISCEFAAGAFHFIVGPSGSGKSSLLYLLGALDQPTTGSIEIDGRSLTNWTEREKNRFRREDVGFIFQNFNLMSNLTAWENVLVPYLPGGMNAALRQQAQDLLVQVGLKDRLTHKPGHLSGGEQQRVAIARALLKQPRLILADEPTGELDSQTGQAVLTALRHLHQNQQATVIIVTHDVSHIRPEDYVHRIHDGVIVGTQLPQSSPSSDSGPSHA